MLTCSASVHHYLELSLGGRALALITVPHVSSFMLVGLRRASYNFFSMDVCSAQRGFLTVQASGGL
jgi:hypothetical protein